MQNKDIRWIQRFDTFKKAFENLDRAVTIKERDQIQKAGLVQFFEIIFELSWKMLKDYLYEQGFIDIFTPRAVIKKAFEIDLIKKGHTWLKLLSDRNLTVHTYNEEIAEKIDKLIENTYYPLFKELYKTFSGLERDYDK